MHRMNRILPLCAAVAALAPSVAPAAPRWRAEIGVAGYAGTVPLTNFPVLVRLSETAVPGFHYADCAADGADLAFSSADGETAFPREIESWNANGESLVWVRIPVLTNGLAFSATWGDPATASQPASQTDGSVWRPSGYVGVWHMAEADGAVADSAARGLDAVPSGPDAANGCVAVAGPVGNGRQCATNAASSALSYLSVPFRTALNVGERFAVSGWFDVSAEQSGDARLFSRKADYTDQNGWEALWKPSNNNIIARGASGANIAAYIPSPAFAGNGWRHVCIVYEGGNTAALWENGVLKKRNTYAAAPLDNGKPLAIGGYAMDAGSQLVGSTDECRLLGAVPSAEWIRAEYDTQAGAGFFSFGAVARMPADFILVEGSPSRYAAGGSPAYGRTETTAAGVHAFSAPESVELSDGTRAFCTGWSLYAVADGAETLLRTSAEPEAGEDDRTCRVDYAGSGGMKLVWNWEVRHLVSASAGAGGSVSPAAQWVADGATATIAATPDAGFAFARWTGGVPAIAAFANPLALAVSGPAAVAGEFAPASGALHVWTGAAGDGLWETAGNWDPATVPTAADDVKIESAWVTAAGSVVAKSLMILGNGSDAGLVVGGATASFAGVKAQTALDPASTAPLSLAVAGNLSLAGAALSLGARRGAAPVSASIGGDFTLAGGAVAAFYAGPYEGPLDDFGRIPLENCGAAATVVSVGGELILSGASTLIPENDLVTGSPVRFAVAGDVTIGASAAVDASNRGWGWTKIPEGGAADPRSRRIEGGWYTLAPGFGVSFTVGGAYGGTGTIAVNGRDSGVEYGYRFAPVLPGSPCGVYSDKQAAWRPGGTVWIETPGTLALDGAVRADSTDGSSTGGRPSGGGIRLACGEFLGGADAALSACSTSNTGGSQAPGTGGRISLAVGVSAADLAALAAGSEPAGLSYSDSISLVSAAATGGTWKNNNTGTTYPGVPGTCTTVMGAMDSYPLFVSSVPAGVVAPGLDYATVSVDVGKPWSATAPAYAFDPERPDEVGYAFAGWVVSNTVGEVASGTNRTAAFVPDTGPFALTWIWGAREHAVAVRANDPALGAVAVSGGVPGATGTVWLDPAATATAAATPAAGAEFLFWTGDVPWGKAKDNPISFEATVPRRLTAVFRVAEAPTTRTWAGATRAAGEWTDPSKWSPANIPGFGDSVVVGGSGWVVASNRIEVSSLEIRDDAIVLVADRFLDDRYRNDGVTGPKFVGCVSGTRLEEAAVVVSNDLRLAGAGQLAVGYQNQYYHASVDVGGDLALDGTAKFLVAGGPVGGPFTFEDGAGFVDVGGTLRVGGSASLHPRSEQYTGGSVVFRADRFVLGTNATVDAVSAGFRRILGRDPISLAPGVGFSFHVGGGYGGTGYGREGKPEYGMAYGSEWAPIHPGSSGGDYGIDGAVDNPYVTGGGGLVRVHSRSMEIAGTIDANAAPTATTASSSSGGGIWLVSRFAPKFSDTASLRVRGGYRCTGAGKAGGGGRAAIGIRLSDEQLRSLVGTGTMDRVEMFDATADWLAAHPLVSVDLADGEGETAGEHAGTFRVLDATLRGTTLIIR